MKIRELLYGLCEDENPGQPAYLGQMAPYTAMQGQLRGQQPNSQAPGTPLNNLQRSPALPSQPAPPTMPINLGQMAPYTNMQRSPALPSQPAPPTVPETTTMHRDGTTQTSPTTPPVIEMAQLR